MIYPDNFLSNHCPVCGAADWRVVLHRENVPVCCHQLTDDADSARTASRGEIELCQCNNCSLIYNRRFDASLIDYSGDYENALHFSPRFVHYLEELVDDLRSQCELDQSRILEIGCGDGKFLELLTAATASRGVGFEPSAPRVTAAARSPVEIRARCFTCSDISGQYDLACLRHVIEHVPEPVTLMNLMRHAVRVGGHVYVEVPSADYMVRAGSVWDLIYEHCLYFTADSLSQLLLRAGFTDVRVEERFGGQFLAAHGTVGAEQSSETACNRVVVIDDVAEFGVTCDVAVRQINRRIREETDRGTRLGIWGAGTKGIMLLNALENPESIAGVFDINPRKHGRFIPGAGVPIRSPEHSVIRDVDALLVMNPMYVEEIRGQLETLGHRPELIAA